MPRAPSPELEPRARPSQPRRHRALHRPVGAVGGREGARRRLVPPARRSRSRDSRHAGRSGPPARSRRPRLDRRHRRRRVRAWSGSAPTAIVSSPLNVGSGTVRCAHGVFPVPAPATVRLLKGVPDLLAGRGRSNSTTPTGALLVTDYAAELRPDAGDARQRRSATAPATRISPVIRTCSGCGRRIGRRRSRSSGSCRSSARSTT